MIAVLDSGLGGVAVLRELVARAPALDYLYLADHAGHPYGARTDADIAARIGLLAVAAVRLGAGGIVVACNTATAVAVEALRAAHPDLPVVGVEPPVKPAAALTVTGIVGVLATAPTAASARIARLVETHAEGVRVLVQPCPGLADAVEAGAVEAPATEELLARFVGPLVAEGADVLALGCTHYTFLEARIRHHAGPAVTLVDPSEAVARRALAVIPAREGSGRVRWFSTASGRADGLGWAWGEPVQVEPVA